MQDTSLVWFMYVGYIGTSHECYRYDLLIISMLEMKKSSVNNANIASRPTQLILGGGAGAAPPPSVPNMP